MPEWLSSTSIVNLIMIVLTFVTLVFTITSSDNSISLIKKIFLFLGRSILGAFVMGIRVFFASLIIDSTQNKIDLALLWQRYFTDISTIVILVVLPGMLTAVIAASGGNLNQSIKRSVVGAIITIFIVNALTSNISFSILWLSNEIITSAVAGLAIALLLQTLRLRVDAISAIKNPFYD